MTFAALEPTAPDPYRDFPVARTRGGTAYVDIGDEYVAWLSLVNAGMLNRGNLLCFDHALRNLPSATAAVVEIGAFCGLSTNLLSHYRRLHGVTNPFFNCDRWLFEGAAGNVGDTALSHDDYRRFVRDTYLRNVRMFSPADLPHTIELLSDEFFAAWDGGERRTDAFGRPAALGGPIGFCYVDGNHTYAFAKRDFENADRFLEPGGFVLFDDSADGSKWEVTRVIDELKRRDDYRVVARNPNYLVQKTR